MYISIQMEPTEDQTYKSCLNCGHLIPDDARYCSSCGQKYTTGLISLKDMFSDFFQNFLNLEFAIFPTLRDLFIPGKLTIEYFKGRHKTYIKPIRIFFLSTLVLIAAINFSIHYEEIDDNFYEEYKEEYHQKAVTEDYQKAKAETFAIFDSNVIAPVFDTLESRFDYSTYEVYTDSVMPISIGFLTIGLNEEQPDSSVMRFLKSDIIELTPDEIIEKYEIKGLVNQVVIKQIMKFFKDMKNFIRFSFGMILWTAFFMIPLLALLFKLLYIRRRYYFIEHLVFFFHIHTFAFLLTAFYLAFGEVILKLEDPLWWLIIVFGVVWLIIYILIAQKRVYSQSWFKTLVKSIIFFVFYWFTLGVSLALTFLLGFLFF